MRVTVADRTSGSGVCEYKNLGTSYTTIDARVYVRLSAAPANGKTLQIFGFSTATGWLANPVGTRIDIVNNNGNLQWDLNYYSSGWKNATAGAITVGTWNCIEVKLVIGTGSGETHLYVNGAELVSKTGLTNTAPGSSVEVPLSRCRRRERQQQFNRLL